MQKFSNFKCDLYNNCKTVKSLFEVENFLKNFFEVGLSSENRKKRPASRNGPAGRRNVL